MGSNLVCIVTSYTKEIDIIGRRTDDNKKAYCTKHGYTYVSMFGRLSDRHPAWDKVLAVQRVLPYYDWVIWMDADCVFNNFDKTFTLDKCGVFCKDIARTNDNWETQYVNTGVFALKNCPESFALLSKVWNHGGESAPELAKRSYHGWPWDQGPICRELMSTEDFLILDDMDMNCHPNIANAETFIIHYMGWRADERYEKKTLAEIDYKNRMLL